MERKQHLFLDLWYVHFFQMVITKMFCGIESFFSQLMDAYDYETVECDEFSLCVLIKLMKNVLELDHFMIIGDILPTISTKINL